MASIMRDALTPYVLANVRDSIRILGFTASILNGEMKNEAKKRRQLEAFLFSNIHCLDIPPSISDDSYQTVPWVRHARQDNVKAVVELLVGTASTAIDMLHVLG